MKITIGADPELFVSVINPRTGKKSFRSAHDLVPGTKENPHPVNKGAVQVDGMALEFNIDPVDNADDFVTNINTVLGELRAMVPEEYAFEFLPAVRFHGSHFRAVPEEAKELGCTPDYDAYSLDQNPMPDNQTTMRTASGHVHIGFCEDADVGDDAHIQRCATLVKQLDYYLGLPSLWFDHNTSRRKMYGKAGAFRPKPYGVEYRVLSNAWLREEKHMRFVFNATTKAVTDLLAGTRPWENQENTVIGAINCSDLHLAQLALARSDVPLLLKDL